MKWNEMKRNDWNLSLGKKDQKSIKTLCSEHVLNCSQKMWVLWNSVEIPVKWQYEVYQKR